MTTAAADQAQIVSQLGGSQAPGIAQTFDRRYINANSYAPATGVLQMSGIWLPAGVTVTNIILFSGTTGVTTNTHNWAALYTNGLVLLAQSADDTGSTDYAGNTKISKALSTAQVTPYTGLYYIGWMQAATTPNTVLTAAAPASSIANADAPVVSATSTGSLTTTAPATAGSLTAVVQSIYAYVT